MKPPTMLPLDRQPVLTAEDRILRARCFAEEMSARRSVRHFSSAPVSREVITHCLRAACSAPSGANQQPWHFVAVSDPGLKRRIREAAEAEEREFYTRRAPAEWLQALAPLGTDADKPFLEQAPWLIAVFLQRFGQAANGSRVKHYYTDESVGIATGLLIAACHQAGLATLTHTPSPMGFLNDLLDRPRRSERPFLLLVVGLPAEGARVPAISRKPLAEVVSFREAPPATD
ncbi:MAG: nitroreductase family protein [Steroidobacteraceae bacterium]